MQAPLKMLSQVELETEGSGLATIFGLHPTPRHELSHDSSTSVDQRSFHHLVRDELSCGLS